MPYVANVHGLTIWVILVVGALGFLDASGIYHIFGIFRCVSIHCQPVISVLEYLLSRGLPASVITAFSLMHIM